ncbi:hypothetical protein CRENBAI_022301 [Crenichthys baileyi]|uniref:Uncharacterized protein n=1 Tax=Crenichthys baileyi TaxID=28760 RepID=A0AAV9S9P2_9TELE
MFLFLLMAISPPYPPVSLLDFQPPSSPQAPLFPLSRLKQSVSSANPPLDAATAWWCYKSNIVFWCVRHHKGDLETEMWRNTHSEMELHSEDGAEPEHNEELSMKYSSDIQLCVNPCI